MVLNNLGWLIYHKTQPIPALVVSRLQFSQICIFFINSCYSCTRKAEIREHLALAIIPPSNGVKEYVCPIAATLANT